MCHLEHHGSPVVVHWSTVYHRDARWHFRSDFEPGEPAALAHCRYFGTLVGQRPFAGRLKPEAQAKQRLTMKTFAGASGIRIPCRTLEVRFFAGMMQGELR